MPVEQRGRVGDQAAVVLGEPRRDVADRDELGGRQRGRVERLRVDREQRPLVLHAEQQRLGAVRQQPRQLDQRQPLVVHEHRGLGEHHGAAAGVVEPLGHPGRVATARGDAVQARALEGVGRSHGHSTVACRDAPLGPRAARPVAARLRRACARPRRDVPPRLRRRRPAGAAAARLDVLGRSQLVPHVRAAGRGGLPGAGRRPPRPRARAALARPVLAERLRRRRGGAGRPRSRSRPCSPSATRWAGRSPRCWRAPPAVGRRRRSRCDRDGLERPADADVLAHDGGSCGSRWASRPSRSGAAG